MTKVCVRNAPQTVNKDDNDAAPGADDDNDNDDIMMIMIWDWGQKI